MTRKRSNVKALALAVTCAILAGGYSGLSPVYAADVTVNGGTITVPSGDIDGTNPTTGKTYNVTGITASISDDSIVGALKGKDIFSNSITASSAGFNGLTIQTTPGGNSITLHEGAITATGNVTAGQFTIGAQSITETKIAGYDSVVTAVNDANTGLVKKASQADVEALQTTVGATENDGLQGKVKANLTDITNLKAAVGDNNSGLVQKTTNISYVNGTGTSVDGVTFNAGAVTGVKSINGTSDTFNVDKDGKLTAGNIVSKGYIKAESSVEIGRYGSTYAVKINKDGIYAGGDSYNNAKAAIGTDGTLKAGNGNFNVDEEGKLFGADSNKKISVDQLTTDSANVAGITRDGTNNTTTIEGKVKIKNDGTVTGVSSINGKVTFEDDGTVYINKDADKNQIKIGTDGKVIIGKTSSAYDEDGFYAGGHSYNEAKAAIGSDGSLKAANGNFNVDKDGNLTVAATSTFTGETTFSGGIKTDTISEVTTGAGVTVNGNKITTDNKFNDVTLKDGSVEATNITATGALSGTTLSTTGDATVGGKLTVTGKTTLNDELEVAKGLSAANGEFVVNGTTGDTTIKGQLFAGANGTEFQVDSNGAITANSIQTAATSNNSIGGITLNNGALEAKTLKVTDTLTAAKFNVTNLKVDDTLTVGTNTKLQDGTLTLGTDTQQNLTAAQLKNINSVVKDNGVIEAANDSKVGNVTFNNGAISGVTTISATGNISTTADISGKDITASGTVKGAKITDGTASLENGALTGATSVTVGSTTINTDGVATNKLVVGAGLNATTIDESNGVISAKGEIGSVKFTGAGAMTDVTSIDGVAVAAGSGTTGGLTIGTGGSAVTLGATDAPISTANFKVTNAGDVSGNTYVTNNGTTKLSDNSLHLDNDNYWNNTDGIHAKQATIGANTLNADGISTTGKLDVAGKATFGDSTGTHTTINGGTITSTNGTDSTTIGPDKIKTKTLEADTIILNDHMQDGSGNKIEIGADGHLNVASAKFKVNDKGEVTNEYNGTDTAGKTTKTTFKTSVDDGINANYTNSENNNNNLLNIDKNGVGLGVTDTTGKNLGMFSANATSASIGFGTDNSVVVDAKAITSKLGSDVTSVMTNDSNEKSIVDTVGSASRTLKADSIVDSVAGKTITTDENGTKFANGSGAFTTINGSSVRSYDPATGAGHLNGATLNLFKDADNATYMTAGGAEFIGDAGEKGGKKTTIKGGTITTDTLNVERINLGGEVIDKGAAGVEDNSKLYMDAQGNFRAASGKFKVAGNDGAMTNTVGNTTLKTDTSGASMSYDNSAATGGVKSDISVANDSAKMSSGASYIEVTNDGITNKGKTTFEGSSGTTTIDGGTIKTGHLITDKLTITGSGNADGSGSTPGSVAFGADGTIKSDIVDGNDHTTFETTKNGTTTTVNDGTYNAESKVTAKSIGSVITGGTVDISQTLDGETGKITNAAGATSTELSNDGFAVKQNGYTDVNIAKGDVSVTNKQTGKQVNLSDLGSLGDLNEEITSREEYTSNKTAVGAINAEAGIRREEVARLDGRINDVNDRVNKVGAMAAAIASLKSIGYDPQAPSEFSIGLGQYKGETGVAMGFFHYPNKNFMINVSLSTAGGETMGGIGATWRFGHKSPQKLLDEQREAQAKKELAAAEKYKVAAQLAKEAQERAEYAAKLARQAQVSADNAKAAADATQAKHF